jgi:AcrR family transcriptional regulator
MNAAGRPTQTTPEAWVDAALKEIEQHGLRELSVQAVARRLGVTKGGFYHHFTDRRELIRAAVDRWEGLFTTELAERFDAVTDPRERLRGLFAVAGLELRPTVVVQLMAAADDPDVADVLARAATARLDLLIRIFTDLGLDADAARNRAVLAYSAYLGLADLRRHAPAELTSPERMQGYVAELESTLVAP